MTTKEQALKHLDELEEKTVKKIEEETKKAEKQAAGLVAVEAEIQRLKNGMKAYEHLDAALSELIESKLGTMGEGSNPTPGGTVNTTLTDIKHVVHVPVKEEEVTIDTSTNRGKILRLAAKGFFKDWRKAKDVIDELERRGTAIHDKVVMMELAQLAKLGYLGRTTIEHQFAYKVPDEGVVFKPD